MKAEPTMPREKFGISLSPQTVEELDSLVAECVDLKASRSEIVEAILTAHFEADEETAESTRELVAQLRRRQFEEEEDSQE